MNPDPSPFVQLVSHRTALHALDAYGNVWWYDDAYYESADAQPKRVWRPLAAERVDK